MWVFFQEVMIISRKNIHDCVAEKGNVQQLLFEVNMQSDADAIPLGGALLPLCVVALM